MLFTLNLIESKYKFNVYGESKLIKLSKIDNSVKLLGITTGGKIIQINVVSNVRYSVNRDVYKDICFTVKSDKRTVISYYNAHKFNIANSTTYKYKNVINNRVHYLYRENMFHKLFVNDINKGAWVKMKPYPVIVNDPENYIQYSYKDETIFKQYYEIIIEIPEINEDYVFLVMNNKDLIYLF